MSAGAYRETSRLAVIQLSDDDTTASDVEAELPGAARGKALGKRKAGVDVEEKVQWTDDSDSVPVKEKSRKRHRSAAPKRSPKRGTGNKGGAREKKKRTAWVNELDGSGAQDDRTDQLVPDHIQRRRRQFDRNRQILHEAGLRLPPDYADIDLSDDERLETLAERPHFDESSGVKPCRAYKDVELEYSAGLIPAAIAQYLRDYQIEGVRFLHQMFVYQKGGILGDDMGLGKTVQVAAFLTAAFGKTGDERDAKRMRKYRRAGTRWYPKVLIVCPGSLIQNWKNELNRWGWWHVDLFHGAGKEDVIQTARAGRLEVMVTTYVTYKNNRDLVNTVQWDAVVADECHVLKEGSAEVTRAMNEVNALCRIGLTGTAIQNRYEELWTLLNWTNPGHFGTLAEWKQTISRPLTVGQSHDATLYQLSHARKTAKKLVQNLLPEFFLRRMKSLIAHQLPRKSDRVVFCPLTDVQRGAYENFLQSYQVQIIREASDPCPCGSGRDKGWCCHARLEDGRTWQGLVFPTIFTLQRLANHLTLLIPASGEPTERQQAQLATLQKCVPDGWEELYRGRDSMLNLANPAFCGKWKVLRKLLRFWHDNGDKVLIFSHSVRLLRILQHLFHNTSYTVSYLDGSLSYEDRQNAVDDFNSDPGQFVFLISTKAGGVGLNITSANKVVIFDPHWNPSYDLQAQDRAYRIGQVRDVDVFRLISAGTIEEIVYARQIYKQQQANIGYNASNERRYFKGVQQDTERKGELFGLNNLFTFHADHLVLRDIVNKTNIAEAKADIHLSDIDMEKIAQDEDDELALIQQEDDDGAADDEDGGMSQLADFLTAENQQDFIQSKKTKTHPPKSDAVQAILASAGVEYTHENSEVIGTSRVEAQLSRRAELAAEQDAGDAAGGREHGGGGGGALFADSQASRVRHGGKAEGKAGGVRYNPPPDVMSRQFCSMAREFGFTNATDFALVVESWTQEQRRNCLDTFYKRREAKLLLLGTETETKTEDMGDEEAEDRKEDVAVRKEDDDGDVRDTKDIKVEREEMKAENRLGGEALPKTSDVKAGSAVEKRSSTIFLLDDEDDETDEL